MGTSSDETSPKQESPSSTAVVSSIAQRASQEFTEVRFLRPSNSTKRRFLDIVGFDSFHKIIEDQNFIDFISLDSFLS